VYTSNARDAFRPTVTTTPKTLRTHVTPLADETKLKNINKNVEDVCSKLWSTSWLPNSARWWGVVTFGSPSDPKQKEMFDKVTQDLQSAGLHTPLLNFLDKFNTETEEGIKATKNAGLALARNTSDAAGMRDQVIHLDRNALTMLHDLINRDVRLIQFGVDFMKNSDSKIDLTYEANLLKTLEPIRYPYVDAVCNALKTSELGDLIFVIRATMDVENEHKKTPESAELQSEEQYYVQQRETIGTKVADTMLGPLAPESRSKMADAIETYYKTAPNVKLWADDARKLCEKLIARMRGQSESKLNTIQF